MQPFSLCRMLILTLPPMPDLIHLDKRNREAEAKSAEDYGPPRERAAMITRVHTDKCCNVVVFLDGDDARSAADVKRLQEHGFEVSLNGTTARKSSVLIGEGVGAARWPAFVPAVHKPKDPAPAQGGPADAPKA